jgi:S-DNA-T family DNA segregation ATPase FtsK/SpoIIIE
MRKKKPTQKLKKKTVTAGVNHDRNYELLGIAFFTIALISMVGLLGFNVGFVGFYFAKVLLYMFGIGAYIIPLFGMLLGWRYICVHQRIAFSMRFFGIVALFFTLLAIYHHFMILPGNEILPDSLPAGGGLIGGTILFVLRKFFGVDGAIIILFAGLIGSVLLSTTWSLAVGLLKTKKQAQSGMVTAKQTISATYEKIVEVEQKVRHSVYNQEKDQHFKAEDNVEVPEKSFEKAATDTSENPVATEIETPPLKADKIELAEPVAADFSIQFMETESQDISSEVSEQTFPEKPLEPETSFIKEPEKEILPLDAVADEKKLPEYRLPEVRHILSKKVKGKNNQLEKEIADNAKILEATLNSFNVKAKLVNACHGPAVTRYELEPAAGVKVSKIVNLADDISLKLAAPSVRIEAPIPGKAAIGIEVPNKELAGVQLREVLESDKFDAAKSKLTVGLGMDIGGQAIFADLAKMPHLLVAGATGSGKSVCINTIITSVLFKAKPDEVKFILIDPKMVELSNYNGIPHLMVPVVTDAKKAASVLNWAVQEMENRYAKFAKHGVRDMERYNRSQPEDKMPAVVIIIDELADLMMVAPHDVEDAICRLAQKARAAGLHLILATQRPSVDVITGIIKANIPSRISFSVSSQIDSRTILDMSGAEKLLGKGDMLYYPVGASKPVRVQGAFISDQEVEDLLDFIRQQGAEAEANEEIISFTENALKEETTPDKETQQDELLERAIDAVLATGQASSSSLQRRFRIGYTRAARLIDMMEELQIIGPNNGSKPREILMTSEQVYHLLNK